MHKLKKLMVIVPLVLVMVLSSFPVFAEETEKVEFQGTVKMEIGGGLYKEKNYKIKVDLSKFKNDEGVVNKDAIRNDLRNELKTQFIKELEKQYVPDMNTAQIKDSLDYENKQISVEIIPVKTDNIYTVQAVLASDPSKVVAAMKFETYQVASSLVNAVEEFKRVKADALKGYNIIKTDPIDINKDSGSMSATLFLDSTTKPLLVVHILQGRHPVGEVVSIPANLVMSERAGIEIARTRIETVNSKGYKFEKAVYDDGLRKNPLIKEYYEIGGNKVEIKDYQPVLYLYYLVGKKAVDAVKSENGQQQVANQQPAAILTPQQPVTANNALPQTGVSDYGTIFLSAAAMMALGILLAKRK